MARLCERPGCSGAASVAYGFEASRSLVWLEPFNAEPSATDHIRSGVLCRRHAEALTPPRGWWLDDRRNPTPQLFREPSTDVLPAMEPGGALPPPRPLRRRETRPRRATDATSELPFDAAAVAAVDETTGLIIPIIVDDVAFGESASSVPVHAEPEIVEPEIVDDFDAEEAIERDVAGDPEETKAIPWSPRFDQGDDLGGLLDVSSPLLSRAFRGRGQGGSVSR